MWCWRAAGNRRPPLQPTESPSRRERDNAVHHYGHDVVLKRAAGLPLVGRPLPFMLEHGVNFSEAASYEDPLPWVRSYLCMGPRRAERLRRRFGVKGVAVGPYIHYARSRAPAIAAGAAETTAGQNPAGDSHPFRAQRGTALECRGSGPAGGRSLPGEPDSIR